MSEKNWYAFALLMVLCLGGCRWGGETQGDQSAQDTATVDSVTVREQLSPEEEMLEEAALSPRVDELFDDFIYTFTRARGFRNSRIHFPVIVTDIDGTVHRQNSHEWSDSMTFLNGEYTTRFYTSASQLSLDEDTSQVHASVEKINLHDRIITSYDFQKMQGKWMLTACRHQHVASSDMADFLQFYATFSTDSIYRIESISGNLHVSMMDPDQDDQKIDGVIQRDQFSAMCPDVPEGIITNIRYDSQDYTDTPTILMHKNGQGNGMFESFTFEKGSSGWKLVNYEN